MSYPQVKLGDLCEVISGGTPRRSVNAYWNGQIPWVKISDMDAREISETVEQITAEGLHESSAKLLNAGTVLFSIFASIGKVSVLQVEAATNQAIVGVVPRDTNTISSDYLARALEYVAAKLQRQARGVAQSNINISILREALIPLPCMAEQKRIAAILDKADELKAKRQHVIDELDKLQQAVFLDMFGDPDPTWPQLTIAEVALPGGEGMRTGPFGSDLLRSEFVNSGITVLGIDNVSSNHFSAGGGRYITPEKFETLKRYQVSPGDVLISIMGTCGRCAIVPDSIGAAINTKHLCCITLDSAKCLPEYVWSHFLYSYSAKRHLAANTKGAIMAGLNMGIIKRLPIPVPSLELQEEYKKALAALTQQKALGNSSLSGITELIGSLQSRAFRGEL